jgi:hypothetical protein
MPIWLAVTRLRPRMDISSCGCCGGGGAVHKGCRGRCVLVGSECMQIALTVRCTVCLGEQFRGSACLPVWLPACLPGLPAVTQHPTQKV